MNPITCTPTVAAVEPLKTRLDDPTREVAKLREALTLLLYGAEQVVARGVVQPQLNGGIALARAVLSAPPASTTG